MTVTLNGTHVSDSRPSAKQMLPFRAIRSLRDGVILEFDGILADGQRQPYRHVLGDPDNASTATYNAIGKNIWDLMQLYFAVESRVDGLTGERDELQARVKVLEGDLRSMTAKMEEYKRRSENYKKDSK